MINPMELSATATPLSLYDVLKDRLTKCPLSHNKFLPLDILEDVITVENVRASAGSNLKTELLSSNKDLAEEVVRKAKKVYASLVFIERQSVIGALLSEGLTDEHLPLSRRRNGPDRNVLSCRCGIKTFETFRSWKSSEVDIFLEKQWQVQAPVFDTTGSHFNLDPECALPLHPKVEQIGRTAISRVYKCTLYPAHYPQGFKVQTDQVQVAIKDISDEKLFEREKDNLLRIRNLKNRHLIKHIATCQRDSSYYVIFPLANGGTLLDYWELESETPRDPGLVLWSLQQMLGLAEAIRALHHDLGGNLHLRHGDLKPANILLFKEDGDSFLVVADLGVSRIHEQPTLLRRVGTTTEATTRSYEAPEVAFELPGEPRARNYDIWSLGCVFLEFAIWLLYDVNAINNFEENRRQPLQNKDASFYITTDGKADLSKDVLDAIKALRGDPRCQGGTALESLVNLIADKLLVITVNDRCKAEQLRDELQKIFQDAEQNPSYLLKVADQPDPIPKIFLPKPQPSRTW